MGTVLLKVFVGAVAGLACWAILEPLNPGLGPKWELWEQWFTFALGGFIGLGVAGVNGMLQGGKVHALRGFGLGLILGGLGSSLGYRIGGGIAIAVFGPGVFSGGANLVTEILARIVALTPIGLCLGAAIGASSLNVRRIVQGAIGGTRGAAVGAAIFDIVGATIQGFILSAKGVQPGTVAETGTLSRAIYAVSLGAGIALFIAIVERIARSAWVRLRLGRNEGKEWVLDAGQNFIGRSERANIPLFGDGNIAPMHACIIRQGPTQFMLADGGSPIGTLLNGQRVTQAPLFHGAMITVGSYHLEFLLKNQPAPARGPEAYPGQAYPLSGQGYGQPVQPMPQPQPMPQQPVQPMGQPMGQPMQQTQMYPQSPAASMPTTSYPAQQMPVFALVAMDGPITGQRFPIVGPTEVGREGAGIALGYDSMASRRHAGFAPDPMGLSVTDLGSTNGTFVNGQRVQTQTLRPGDLVKIGATTFRVES